MSRVLTDQKLEATPMKFQAEIILYVNIDAESVDDAEKQAREFCEGPGVLLAGVTRLVDLSALRDDDGIKDAGWRPLDARENRSVTK